MTVDPQPVAPDDDDSVDVAGSVRALRSVLVFAGCALVIAILYWTQTVLIPIALAVLLSFLLSPIVRLFERLRFGRIGSVAVVVLIAFCLLGGIAFGVFTQITRLANDLPGYRSNIRQKVADVQGATEGGVIDKLRQAVADVMAAFDREKKSAPRLEQGTDEAKPVPVVMETSVLWQIPTLLEGLASAGLVLVFVIFMLLERRELRDRVIRLLGYGHVAITTRALDEAAGRISRYLVAQSLINAGYGVAIGAGLWFVGVPYALLWGFLTAILRFIPYVGPWLGAGLPVILALAAFPGWTTPLAVIALFLVAELVTNMLVEPLVYGQSAGVSQVALLAAIAFWTWLWGPIGLVLATPLTVCVVVLSKHVPGLRFIYFLMADEPALEPEVRLYQRLLTADLEEAAEVIEEQAGSEHDFGVRAEMLLSAIVRARADRATRSLSREEEHNLYQSARTLLATLAEEDEAEPAASDGEAVTTEPKPAPDAAGEPILGCPADGEGAEIVLRILAGELARQGVTLESLWSGADSLEVLSAVEQAQPRAVCVAALPPRGAAAARYLCRRLRQQFPDLAIVALSVGEESSTATAALRGAGASCVASTVAAAREAIVERLGAAARPASAEPELAVPS